MSDSYPINHAILGGDMQAMEITLEAGQEVIAEAATLLMMEDGITFTARMTDGTEARIKSVESWSIIFHWEPGAFISTPTNMPNWEVTGDRRITRSATR